MVKPVISNALALLALCGLVLAPGVSSVAQEKGQAPGSPSSCSREGALEIIQQQIDLTKTFDDDGRRIAVLLRASDLIWPYQQEKARATFSEALDVATREYKEKRDKPFKEGRLVVEVPDQRYIVITAIAKRDPAWARKLSNQILQDEAEEARDRATHDAGEQAQTGEKLLGTASALLASDLTTAISFAKSSLSYPARVRLAAFLYKLSEVNKGAADQFYQEALIAYAHAPMDQFLYLSSYPFANGREVGEMPVTTFYMIPSGLAPNPSLQRLFVQTLLTRARELVQSPPPPVPGARYSEASQTFMALMRLEPQVAVSLPDLSAGLQELKGNVSALLSQGDQRLADERLREPPPQKSFDEQVEAADRLADAARREGQIGMALLIRKAWSKSKRPPLRSMILPCGFSY